MRKDFQIALLCALSAFPLGLAMSVAPDYFPALKAYPGIFFWGGIGLTIFLLVIAAVIAIRGERAAERSGAKKRMVPFAGMIIFGAAFLGCVAWYFWPSHVNQIPTSEVSARLKKPSALLTYESDRLILYNKGNEGFYIAGDKVGDEARDIAPPPRLVPKDAYYYLFTDRLKTWALDKFGPNTSQLVPFEIYLEDEDKNNKFTGKFALLIVIKDGAVSINAQNFGVTDDLW